MARSFTVTELVTRVRREAGMLGDDNPDDPTIVEALSAEYTALYAILVAKKRGYFQSTQTITTTGVSTVTLPTDYFGTLRIDRDLGDNQPLDPIYEVPMQEIHKFPRTADCAVAFLLTNDTVEFFPTPPAGLTYIHRYIPQPKKLVLNASQSNESDTVDGISGWEERLVLGAVKRLRVAEETDTTDVRNDIDKIEARVQEEADNRNAMQAQTIADVESYDYSRHWWYGARYPR